MKKYVIKYAGGIEQHIMQAVHNSYNEAVQTLMDYLNANNDFLSLTDDNYLTPFDFKIEEVESAEVNEVITDFESAREALGGKPNVDFYVVKRKHSEKVAIFEDIARLVTDINPKHIKALIALNKLFTIAEAWNKEDGFVPDFSDWNQNKWFPWFKYDKDAAGFYAIANTAPSFAYSYFGSRLCFKTPERAEQFGKQFEDLYNKVFL
ncbi:hypothetical protein [Intestinibacter sp.]|uniref:hypothetical protein n=1 Tax=Intestinibacter sp. TaxID=1965304 RepID=UPI002A7594D6|nr:hypothetical protein [Intestinibacter sp.]MDY2736716.1 hypothetical protein [Intestinibacter sp.]